MTVRGLGDGMTQRGRGRPATGTKVQVRIPADQLAEIDRLARESDPPTTRAETIRHMIAYYLDGT